MRLCRNLECHILFEWPLTKQSAKIKKPVLNLPRYFMCLPQPLFTQSRLSFGYTRVKQITVYQSRSHLFVNENSARSHLKNSLAYSSRSHLVLKKIDLLSVILLLPCPTLTIFQAVVVDVVKKAHHFLTVFIDKGTKFHKIKNSLIVNWTGDKKEHQLLKRNKGKSFEDSKIKKFSIQFPLFNTLRRLSSLALGQVATFSFQLRLFVWNTTLFNDLSLETHN